MFENHINLSKKYKAFTLAEVLLTLLIIGVVASLVIPNLINDTQDAELKVAWKKAYGTIAQTYKLARLDDPTVVSGYNCSDGSGKNFYNALKNTMGYTKECIRHTFGNCWADNGVSPDSSVYDPSCPYFKLDRQDDSAAFVARDGTFWLLYGNGTTINCPILAIDLNGNKGPNQWGTDVLSMRIAYDTIKFGECTIPAAILNTKDYLK
jgi:prepilin-type N-terminal cleavage/methylation domain-containing protein